MGDARKIWQAAKASVRQKDWEEQLKFRDDFGPNLDDLEKIASERAEPSLGIVELGRRIEERFGLRVHPRSIERRLRKKKPR